MLNKSLLLLVALPILALAAILFLFKTNFPQSFPSKKDIVIKNEVPGIEFAFRNKDGLMKDLEEKGVWGANTKKITVIFTQTKPENAFFVQNDTKGSMVLSAQVDAQGKGEITITIALGDYLINNTNKKALLPDWVNPRFWQALSLVSPIDKDYKPPAFALNK